MQILKDTTAIRDSVLKAILYFDIFNYPIRSEEVRQFLRTDADEDAVNEALKNLSGQSFIKSEDGYFRTLANEAGVARRIKGNTMAQAMIPIAHRQAQLIAKFPFVRAVLASGSLSKNYMDENSDLDFFIITAPRRLWIARTLLVMYKRIMLRNSFKHFCVNYFVDEGHLEIEEKNLFTATELATLLPLTNYKLYLKLIHANPWLLQTFPNFKARPRIVDHVKSNRLKDLAEKLLNCIALPLELTFMKLTFLRWKRIYSTSYADNDFKIAFKTKKYVSKNHPKNYQQRVMDVYRDKLISFGKTHNISFHD